MVLGNREVIKYLLLTRLQKCQHVLKWCNLLRIFLQFVCLKERNVWIGCLWQTTSKHKPQPTYAEGSAQNLWCIKAGRFIQHKQLIIYFFFPMAFNQVGVFILFLFFWSFQSACEFADTSQGIVKENPSFADVIHFSLSLSSCKPHAVCLLSDPQTLWD